LLGHRGVRPLPLLGLRWRKPGFPPENTLSAFDYAIANGCDGFEFDLRYTRDRRSVLCHDPKLSRHEVAASHRSALERRCGYELPSLENVLVRFGRSAWLDIEMKVAGEEEAVVQALRAHPPSSGYVVSSFLPAVLLRLHDLDPSLPLGYICKKTEDADRWSELPVQAFIPHHSLVSERLVDKVHARRLRLFTWTVNKREDLLRLAAWGVDGLISDDPRLLSQTFPKALIESAS
jgi:glycerophosphoryl diester phosphodiesterase